MLVNCQDPSHRYKKTSQEYSVVPNKRWVRDVTYIWMGRGWAYLAVVLNLFAHKSIGWATLLSPDSILTRRALNMAFEAGGRAKDVLFGSR
jgi:putative transposase